jgi:MoaA/NifB/PqqE/SkfB family radical SAM enzyme
MPTIKDYGYRIVNLEVTNRCNMACSFCPLPIREKALQDIAVKDTFWLLETLAGIGGVDFVAFHQYGEPLLYKGIWDCITCARELGLKTQLVTNGLLLTDRNIEKLLQHPPNDLRISAQTLNPAYHAATRGVDVPFEVYIDRVARCLATLLDRDHGIGKVRTDLAVNEDRHYGVHGKIHYLAQVAGIAVGGDPTINDETPKTLRPHLIGFLKQIELHSRSFTFSLTHLDDCLDQYYSHSATRNLWETAYEFGPNNSVTYKRFVNGRRISQHYPVERSACGTEIIGILADGTVTACCSDYQGFTGLGNIFNEDLISILDRNQAILDGLHRTGTLHFDGCKTCQGAPTRFGAIVKNVRNRFRYPAADPFYDS